MTISTQWSIRNMIRNTSDSGVCLVKWDCVATDGDIYYTRKGSTRFTPNPLSEDFVAYEDLSSDIVVSWVWGAVDRVGIENSCISILEDQLSFKASTSEGLPWD